MRETFLFLYVPINKMRLNKDISAILFLAVLTAFVFSPLLQEGTLPYSKTSDLLAAESFWKEFAEFSYKEYGGVPLWNPLVFAGTPFLAKPYTGVFYPPSFPFLFFGGMGAASSGRWIGSGDILLGTSIGLLLGARLTLLALFFAYVLGALVALTLLSIGIIKRGGTMPFGPLLAGGALLALFAGETILRQYLSLML